MRFRPSLFVAIALSVVSTAIAAEPAESSARPSAESPAAQPASPAKTRVSILKNPAAWVVPEHFAAFVVEGDALDTEWLKGVAATLSRYIKLRVEVMSMPEATDATYGALLDRAREVAGEKARAVVVVSCDQSEPILTATGGRWAVMNPDWIRSDKAADEATTIARMEKQVYRAFGTAMGAGVRPEPAALLLLANAPADLDAVSGCHYHSQNFLVIQAVAARIGMERIRPRPRSELEALGLIPPAKAVPNAESNVPETK